MIENPFIAIDSRLSNIENLLHEIKNTPPPHTVEDEKTPLRLVAAARRIGKAPTTVYALLAKGNIKGHKVGKHWLFYKTDLDAYITGDDIKLDPTTYLVKRKRAEK